MIYHQVPPKNFLRPSALLFVWQVSCPRLHCWIHLGRI
ncbi:hypothetical protein P879_02218 [Paragonimus westermani]|uniref:Uncharacterized protein n=1 Tax=Paragonimus westermani TaxID=34504 RepID=A0A8T0DQA8_9TREM|nr:hypothetical protein P879_02218 [Paragonimus westermani]